MRKSGDSGSSSWNKVTKHPRAFPSDVRPGALTGRLSCGHSETGQTNRLEGTYTVAHSTAIPDPTRFVSLQFQECPFSVLSLSQSVRGFLDVQSNVISRGFLEWESRSFWLDTIPLHERKAASRAMSAQHPRARSRQRRWQRDRRAITSSSWASVECKIDLFAVER